MFMTILSAGKKQCFAFRYFGKRVFSSEISKSGPIPTGSKEQMAQERERATRHLF
jgi:hypothetical protein